MESVSTKNASEIEIGQNLTEATEIADATSTTNFVKETEVGVEATGIGEGGSIVVVEKDTEIVEETTEMSQETEADSKLQTSTILIKDERPLQDSSIRYVLDLVHNLDSFNTKAQSKEPFFWLRKHVEPKSLSGGYFYANEHSESTDFSFFPLSSNDKPKQPIVQAWLKIVYHDTTSEEESTTVEPYYTIESFLIPDLYLAINLEQPSQEGSDTYYPVHFFSKTEVKWLRCDETTSGTSFSLYTYIKEGSESTKFYCSLKSESSLTAVKVFATSNKVKSIQFESPVLESSPPLKACELEKVTSTKEYRKFLVTLPNPISDAVYLNTTDYTLSYRERPSSLQDDLSVIMLLKRVANPHGTTQGYIWSSLVTPNRYLTITGDLIRNNSTSKEYKVVFLTDLDPIPPLWGVKEKSKDTINLCFGQIDSSRKISNYLVPVAHTIQHPAELVGKSDSHFPFHISIVLSK